MELKSWLLKLQMELKSWLLKLVDGIQISNHDCRDFNTPTYEWKGINYGIMTFQVNLSLISSYISIIRYQTCFFQRDIKNAGPLQRGKIYTKALWQFFCHNRVFKTDSLLGFHSFGLVITERYYIPSKIPYIPGITFNPA